MPGARAFLALAVACLAAGCAPRPPAPRAAVKEVCAPMPPCPSWVAAFREHPATLHVYAYDGVSGTSACAAGAKVVKVQAFLDDVAVGQVDVPCLPLTPTAAQQPPPMYRIEGPSVTPGLHELRLDVTSPRGTVQGKTLVSLPAFDIPADGQEVHVGAEISVGIGPDDLAIGPPQVYSPNLP